MKKYVLAIDQGTTQTTVIIFDKQGKIKSKVSKEFTQYFPKPGWVEHNPEEIWDTTQKAIAQLLKAGKIKAEEINSIGITNQRETTVVWDKNTFKPVYNAIVWQCRRTSSLCEKLKKEKLENLFKEKTGLIIDAYFSATKLAWILENIKGVRNRANKSEILFGTIDSYLLYNLTNGKVHATDYSNASRTMLFNIRELNYDKEILKILKIPENILPKVYPSSYFFGETKNLKVLPDGIPISGMAGDQQAALFGQCCFEKGMAKNTYGTGCFLLLNTGENLVLSKKGLLTTIGWGLNNKVYYVVEGGVFIAGAVVQWLRDGLNFFKKAKLSEKLALSVKDNGGVVVVPTFVGLGAPYWDMYARGAVFGLTRGTTKAHITRAALESIAFQSADVLNTMQQEAKINLKELRVDGGAAENNFLLQFQTDIMNLKIIRPKILETTALGVAYLSGLATGFWENLKSIKKNWQKDKEFNPKMKKEKREKLHNKWLKAVERVKNWEDK